MLDPIGYWSYARQDDALSNGTLSQLRAIIGTAIVRQYGTEVRLWRDTDSIPLAVGWADAIEQMIDQTTFFIPIVTPRFLQSQSCYYEYAFFQQRANLLGRDDLIFPIHYVNVYDLQQEETVFGDGLADLRKHQWIDWRPYFDTDPRSQEMGRQANHLATTILRTLRRPNPRTATAAKIGISRGLITSNAASGDPAIISAVGFRAALRPQPSMAFLGRMRGTIRIIAKTAKLTGLTRAVYWFHNEPIADYGNKTAAQLVHDGHTNAVMAYLRDLENGANG